MKTKFLFILLSLFLLSCSKEKREEREEKKLWIERENILEVYVNNCSSHDLTNVQISLLDQITDTLVNTEKIKDLIPGEKIMFLYNCQGKIPKGAGVDMGFELRYKLDALDSIEKLNFLGVYDGTIHVRGLQLDFYDDTIVFTPLIWKW